MKRSIIYFVLLTLVLAGCKRSAEAPSEAPQEDRHAKQLLQGIWLGADEGDPFFQVKGDTIFYPDSTSLPVGFKVIQDTLILEGSTVTKYPIVRQSAHLFEFINQNGETIRLTKSEDADDEMFFENQSPVVLNQNQLIKRDTIIVHDGQRYHCYVQVNPTTYKVIKPSFNDDGVEVDNIYYDNTIHLAVFQGTSRVYSHDFYKKDFKSLIPESFLRQSILSDMTFLKTDAAGVHYQAQLYVPDSMTSYVVEITISFNGKLSMQLAS
ncbi:MAG: DUF4738 domain-containing protein [Prevotella sp.]|nr:DUF4738 domain-containing protein [Prevotella sp.]